MTGKVRTRVSLLSATVLAVGVVVALPEPAMAASCLVRNIDTGVVSSSLQHGVHLANGGDRLRVVGRCVGDTDVDKPLTIVGVRSDGRPESVLEGTGDGPVLRIAIDAGKTVVVAELLITGGAAEDGGGIRAGSGNLVLRGTYVKDNQSAIFTRDDLTFNRGTHVVRNRGGVEVRGGYLTMNGSSRVSRNVGGGIWLRSGRTLTMNDSASVTENSLMGIVNYGNVVMNGHSTVARNGSAGIITADRWATTTTLNEHASVHDNVREGIETTYDGDVFVNGTASIYGNGETGIRVLHSGDVTMTGGASVWGNTGVVGGGVYGTNKVILSDEATIWGNIADNGGGIYVGGTLFMNGSSSIVDNSVTGDGGGVMLGDPRNDVEVFLHGNAVISGNTADRGAGIFNTYRVLMDGSSSITANTAAVEGGGVFNVTGATVTLAELAQVFDNVPDDIVNEPAP